MSRKIMYAIVMTAVLVATAAAQQKAGTRVQVEGQGVIYSRQGFHPPSIQRTAGKVVLFIENRSDVVTPVFQLNRDTGAAVQNATGKKDKRNLGLSLDLTPGTYVLSETTHPTMSCKIIVTAK